MANTRDGEPFATSTPDPDDPRKPDSPTDLTKPSFFFVLRKVIREFSKDQCTDLAAALTYYAVLSLFPALLALVSLLGIFGQGQKTVDSVLQMVDDLGPSSAVDTLRVRWSSSSTPPPPVSRWSSVYSVPCGRRPAMSARSAGR